MNLTARLRRAFDTRAEFYEYAELTTPPANDGIKGDWAVCYGSGVPVYFGPKTDATTWPAGAANPGPTGATGPSIAAWSSGLAVTSGQLILSGTAFYLSNFTGNLAASIHTDIASGNLTLVSGSTFGRVETVNPKLISGFIVPPAINQLYYNRVRGAGAVGHITVEVGVSAGNMVVAVFAGSSNAPSGAALATSGTVAVPAFGLQSISLGGTVGVADGDFFAVAFDNATVKLRCAASATGATGVGTGETGFENITGLALPTSPNPSWAPKYVAWMRGDA